MKFGTKVILLNSSALHKQNGSVNNGVATGLGAALSTHHQFHRLWILALLSISTFTFIFTRIPTTTPTNPPLNTDTAAQISPSIADALLFYATSNTTDRMTPAELTSIATVLRECRHPCNLLVFGLSHETLLWHFLNHNHNNNQGGVAGAGSVSGEIGRTVFLDEKEYRIAHYEDTVPGFEGYDVKYTTSVSSLRDLITESRRMRSSDCRPVQNLLFSDCPLAINDLPNHLYEIPWDVIIVDGPGGYSPDSPGRMSVIFTAAVLARSKQGTASTTRTHVFVHEYGREAERVCGEEFLCRENLVGVNDSLAHFVVGGGGGNNGGFKFCRGKQQGKKSKVKPNSLVLPV